MEDSWWEFINLGIDNHYGCNSPTIFFNRLNLGRTICIFLPLKRENNPFSFSDLAMALPSNPNPPVNKTVCLHSLPMENIAFFQLNRQLVPLDSLGRPGLA